MKIAINANSSAEIKEYRIEDQDGNVIHDWQENNVFNDVPRGGVVLRARDVAGCEASYALDEAVCDAEIVNIICAPILDLNISDVEVEEVDDNFRITITANSPFTSEFEYRIEDTDGNVIHDWQTDNVFEGGFTEGNDYVAIVRDEFLDTAQQEFTAFLAFEQEFEATSEGATGDIQTLTVPYTGQYRITAYGAAGGLGDRDGERGLGAKMGGVFDLSEGDNLNILVGQQGQDSSGNQPSGGGGSFVVDIDPPDYKDTEEISVVFNTINDTPDSTFEQPLIDILTNSGMGVDTVSDDDLTSFDFSGYDIFLFRAPGDQFDPHPEQEFIQNLELPVMGFGRQDAREILGIGDSSGTSTQSDFDLSPDPNFKLSGYEDNVALYDSETGQAVSDIEGGEPGTVVLAIDDDEIGIAYRFRDNGYVGVHSSMHRGNSLTQQGEEVFVSVVQHAVTAKKIEDVYQPLIVAGGAGAYGVGTSTDNQDVIHGHIESFGKDGIGGAGIGEGGTDGGGGGAGGDRAGGAGGFLTDGEEASSNDQGRAYINDGFGGEGQDGSDGGYGGGSAVGNSTGWGACGAGGGYSGGGGGYSSSNSNEGAGGGGGSYNTGTDQENESGVRDGHGKVEIERVG